MAKKAKLGTGKRFQALKGKLAKQGVSDPEALAAAIGRKNMVQRKWLSYLQRNETETTQRKSPQDHDYDRY